MKLPKWLHWLRRGRKWEAEMSTRPRHIYAEKDGHVLDFDWYPASRRRQPIKDDIVIIYVHGGGFSEGSPREERYIQFARRLAEAGYPVAAITYRLTMQGLSFSCDQEVSVKRGAFRAAAEDIWDVTRYLRGEQVTLGLHNPRIVLCGSSAGAEAVCCAAYWPEPELPAGFRYAGVIGMAAAVLELDWITPQNALPMLLYHGIDDPWVPYATAPHHYCTPDQPGYLLLHGSASIAARLAELAKPYTLVTGTTGGHGWADKPMFSHLEEIIDFLEEEVGKKNFRQRSWETAWR